MCIHINCYQRSIRQENKVGNKVDQSATLERWITNTTSSKTIENCITPITNQRCRTQLAQSTESVSNHQKQRTVQKGCEHLRNEWCMLSQVMGKGLAIKRNREAFRFIGTNRGIIDK
jgi:hypothetical protein